MSQHIAMCGLDCSKCAAFIATQNNDNKLRAKTAQEWMARHQTKGEKRALIKPEDINCYGCLSQGPLYQHCQECEVRKCGQEKGLENCQECPDYKCAELRKLHKRLW